VPALLSALALFAGFACAGAGATIDDLRCEWLANPLGMDIRQPSLSWNIRSTQRGWRQSAYEIFAASNESLLAAGKADLWDSGKVPGDETIGISYAGQPLASRQRCFWKVRVWDADGNSVDSAAGHWEMGLLQPQDWQAKWIARTSETSVTNAPLLRRAFSLDGRIKQARLYVCGLGYFEIYINGKRVGDHLLDPAYTRYDRRDLYVTHDVTALLRQGENAIGAILGNGWYNVQNKAAWDFDKAPWRAAPKLLCQLEVELADHPRVVIESDASWKSADSPIVSNTIYSGEVYDARRERQGWGSPGFNDSSWDAALIVAPPQGQLSAQMLPPIRADKTLKPVNIKEPSPGVFVFDFGQNLAGFTQLRVQGPAGTEVSLKHGERLAGNGLVDQRDIAVHLQRFDPQQPFQTDTYTLKGGGVEQWNPRFTYHGFQYVEVRGFPGRPDANSLRAISIHSDIAPAGVFECSNPLLDEILEAARWSYLGNLQGIPTDCPHREKNGWTGDAHLAAEQGMFNFFPAPVYSKWIQDLADEQKPDGRLPGIVPTGGWGYAWGNGPAWDSALLLIPFYQYVYFCDKDPFRRHYEAMKRYVDYLSRRAKEGIVNIGLNDWAPYRTETDAAITDTGYYFVDANIVALAAKVLGKNEDARHYGELARQIQSRFNAKFYHADTGLYDNGGQTALSCALYQGLVPPENKQRVLSNLVAVVERENWHIDTGILGAKYLLNALTQNGRPDVAYRIAAQEDLPSWGWWIRQGATTLWEQWRGGDSRFHIMYGDVAAWFYKALAGINPDPAAPGFKHFFIAPNVVGGLTSAGAEYQSVRGRIISRWKTDGKEISLDLTVPANTTATVTWPGADSAPVLESGQPLAQAAGVHEVRSEAGHLHFDVGSGAYQFTGPSAQR
jgi:alpha-L-rhamnosidase